MSTDRTAMSVEEFQARVRHHLTRALAAIPDVVPDDVMDESIGPMIDELNSLDELLYGFGADTRDAESKEREREQRVVARRRIPALEDVVMKIDRRVQSTIRLLGTDAHLLPFLAPMHADLLAAALVQLLDHFPASTFAQDRCIPPDFASEEDPTVAGIVALMRERKALSATHNADGVSPT